MKRTQLRRLTPLRARSTLKATSRLRANTPLPARTARIKPRSDRMAAIYVERRALVERLLRERPRCEFPGCRRKSWDVHELMSRTRGGVAGILDEANCRAVCRLHHGWIHDHPVEANAMGWLKHSWQE